MNFNIGSFEEAWPLLQTGVDRIINQIEKGLPNSIFSSNDYMSYYHTVYELCTGPGSRNSKLLYDQYKKVFEEYINSMVLPSLQGKKDELLLRELLRRWSNHKIMTSRISRLFSYLERFDIFRLGLPSLQETSFLSFYDLVYGEINEQIVDAILSMIDQERAGQQVDRTLVNNTLAIYSEIGDGPRKNHAKGFHERMIKHIAEFNYDDVASEWIASLSINDNTKVLNNGSGHGFRNFENLDISDNCGHVRSMRPQWRSQYGFGNSQNLNISRYGPRFKTLDNTPKEEKLHDDSLLIEY